MSQKLVKLSNRLTPNQRRFVVEVMGTFIVAVFATDSVIIDSKMHGVLGISFIAFEPFVGIAVYNFPDTTIDNTSSQLCFLMRSCWSKILYLIIKLPLMPSRCRTSSTIDISSLQ